MPDIFPVKPHVAARAHPSIEEYERLYRLSLDEPRGFWGEQAKALDWFHPWHERARRRLRGGRLRLVLGRPAERLATTASTATSPRAATRPRSSGPRDEPGDVPAHHLPRAQAPGLPHRQRAARPRRPQGRPRLHLHADDPRDSPTRCSPARASARCTRSCSAGFSAESLRDRILDARCQVVVTANEGLRGGKRIPLKATVDQAVEGLTLRARRCWSRAAPTPRCRCERAATCGSTTRCAKQRSTCTGGVDGRRGSALHPLHLGQHREAQGRAPHDRRLPRVRRAHPQARVRLPPRRRLLLRGRRRLDHRPQLHRLRPARQRRDHRDVRVDARLSRTPGATGGWSTTSASTSSTPRPPRCAPSRRPATSWVQALHAASRCACWARVGEPINPEIWRWYHDVVGEGRCAVVDTWWQTETGGILITPLPGVTPTKPGSATLPFFGVKPVVVEPADGTGARRQRRRRRPVPRRAVARPGAHRLRRPPALQGDLLHASTRATTSPATAAGATRTATTGSPAASTTC